MVLFLRVYNFFKDLAPSDIGTTVYSVNDP